MRKKTQTRILPKKRKQPAAPAVPAKNYKLVALNQRGFRIGEDHPNAAATDHEVELVVQLHEEGVTYTDLAEKFGVHRETIAKWCRGQFRGQATARFRKV